MSDEIIRGGHILNVYAGQNAAGAIGPPPSGNCNGDMSNYNNLFEVIFLGVFYLWPYYFRPQNFPAVVFLT